MGYLRAGDTLVVWRLDRLGRSLRHLVETVNALAGLGVAFASLHEGIDTPASTGPSGLPYLRRAGRVGEARDITVAELARALGVGRGTIYRALQQAP